MSGNRDCQETSPDRGPPAAVELRQSIYGMHNAGDGHMPGPTNRVDGQGTDGRGSLYGRSSASRPWDDGNEAEYIPGPSLRSPPGRSPSFRFSVKASLDTLSGQPGSLPYYDLPRPSPSEPNPSRHIPNYAPSTTLDTRGGANSSTSVEIPTSQYYGESSTSYHQQSSMQVRIAQDRAPPYDYVSLMSCWYSLFFPDNGSMVRSRGNLELGHALQISFRSLVVLYSSVSSISSFLFLFITTAIAQ
jgi:hypothetical protein